MLVQSQRTPDTGAAVSKHKEFERSEKDTIEQAHHLARDYETWNAPWTA